MTNLPAAVLWDMDGTLVDTERYWMAAETALVESFGGLWSQTDALGLVGQGLWHSARVLQARGVDLAEAEIIDQLTRQVRGQVAEEIPWRPGARELLTELRKHGVPTGLVTMSLRLLAEHVVASLGFDAFDVVVAGDGVAHSKPHPEPYLRGAELLGVDPRSCMAIEDSAPGAASAVAAGAVTIGVPLHIPLVEGEGYEIWPTLVGRTIHDLSAVFASRARA